MTVNEILALIGAGYTKQDIEAMSVDANTNPAPAAGNSETQKPVQPAPVQEPTPAPAAPAAPAAPTQATPAEDFGTRIIAEIEALKTAMQTMNVSGTAQPAQKPVTAADALASVILPTKH